MTHGRAVATMVAAALMWSLGGVVSRHFQTSEGFEVTFWRSVFASLTVLAWIALRRTPQPFAVLLGGGAAVWGSGLMWAVMFICFMVSLSLTRVANVLIMQSLAPIFTALLAWLVLRRPLGWRTWLSVLVAACGIASIYVVDVSGLAGTQLLGVLVALGIPVAAAINWVIVQQTGGRQLDLSSGVLVGGLLSATIALPLAWPLGVSWHDLGLLALLGVVQLGIPCVMAVAAARHLSAPELSLLALLEVVFGIVLAWAFGGERPGLATVLGGGAVLAALVFNELSRPAAGAPAKPTS